MVADKVKGTPAPKKASEAARVNPTSDTPISKGTDGAVGEKLASDKLVRGAPDATKAAKPDDATAFQNNIMEYMTQRMAALQAGKASSPKDLLKEKIQEISRIKDAFRPEAEELGTPARQKMRIDRHHALLDSLKTEADEIERQIDMGKTPVK